MGITTFGELKTQITMYVKRSDPAFLEQIPLFVQLAEARIHYGAGESGDPLYSPAVRCRAMETDVDVTVTAGVGPLPTGYLGPRRAYWDGNTASMVNYATPEAFWTSDESKADAGTPTLYTIEGDNIQLGPRGTGTLKLLYHKAFDALVDDADTNWLLVNMPALYLHGALIEAFAFSRNGESALSSLAQYRSSAQALARSMIRSRMGSSPLQPRLART